MFKIQPCKAIVTARTTKNPYQNCLCRNLNFNKNFMSENDMNSNESVDKIQFNELLKKELSQFQSTNNSDQISDKGGYVSKFDTPNKEPSPISSIKNAISTILVADFFLVIIFLLWYILAVITQSTTPVVLERFQDIFQPVIVPSLTVLMAGSIASGFLGNSDKKD